MDNKTKATDPQMIDEAIFRMKSIGFPQSYIDAFAANNDIRTFVAPSGEPHIYDEWENGIRCSFEDKFGGYAWAIIKEESSICEPDRVDAYYMLYVSPDPEEWEKEREELAAMKPTMYRVIYHYSTEEEENGFIQKALCLTTEGALVFACRS